MCAADAEALLEDIYMTNFVDLVMQDPTYEPGGKIFSSQFSKTLETRLAQLFTR